VLFSLTPAAAQTSDSDNSNKEQPWDCYLRLARLLVGSRTRKTESHSQNGNRFRGQASVEILRSGRYEPYQDIERESVQVNATTSRTVVRTFGRDSNGQRVLLQMTRRKAKPAVARKSCAPPRIPTRTAAFSSCARKCRTRRRPATVEESTTTVMMPDANGGLAPAMKIQERQERTGDHNRASSRNPRFSPTAPVTGKPEK